MRHLKNGPYCLRRTAISKIDQTFSVCRHSLRNSVSIYVGKDGQDQTAHLIRAFHSCIHDKGPFLTICHCVNTPMLYIYIQHCHSNFLLKNIDVLSCLFYSWKTYCTRRKPIAKAATYILMLRNKKYIYSSWATAFPTRLYAFSVLSLATHWMPWEVQNARMRRLIPVFAGRICIRRKRWPWLFSLDKLFSSYKP